jgi:hypothetical protein
MAEEIRELSYRLVMDTNKATLKIDGEADTLEQLRERVLADLALIEQLHSG